jgi:hypothetical protein
MPDDKKPLMGAKKPLCFVIGPIGKDGSAERRHSDLLLNGVIKHVLQQDGFGYSVKRADEDADPGMIGDRVISDIINAELVVADLTDLNANAFYELGIRHSIEKPTIHIARAGTVLPFDNVAHRTIFVDLTDWYSMEQARERLASSARAIKASEYKVSNPITQANASFKMRQSEDPRDRTLAQMQDRMALLENAIMNLGPHFSAGSALTVKREPGLSERDVRELAALLTSLLKSGNKDEAIELYQEFFGGTRQHANELINAVQENRQIQAVELHRSNSGVALASAQQFIQMLLGPGRA